MVETWKVIAVASALTWCNVETGELRDALVAAHYYVGTEARTDEPGARACHHYIIGKTPYEGPLGGVLAWRRPGVDLVEFCADARSFGEGSRVVVYR